MDQPPGNKNKIGQNFDHPVALFLEKIRKPIEKLRPKRKKFVFTVATPKKLRVGRSEIFFFCFSSNFIFNACFTTLQQV
jgi:hypothetical protein